jgi:hypothetical protein
MGYNPFMINAATITQSGGQVAVADDMDTDEDGDPLYQYLKRVEELRESIAFLPPEPAVRLRLRRSLGLSRGELAYVVGCAPATLKRLETEPGYMPRAVEAHVLNGLALFYRAAGYDPRTHRPS